MNRYALRLINWNGPQFDYRVRRSPWSGRRSMPAPPMKPARCAEGGGPVRPWGPATGRAS